MIVKCSGGVSMQQVGWEMVCCTEDTIVSAYSMLLASGGFIYGNHKKQQV